MSKKRILIADDEPNIVISLEFLMAQAGFEVESVGNGEAALEAIRRTPPDVLLLDVMLPVRDGFEVCQTIRQNPSYAGLKIVMLTAKGRDTEITKGLALGADAYVTKPFATRELLATVKNLAGWKVYVHNSLLPGGEHVETGAVAIRRLTDAMLRLKTWIPAGPLARLLEVKIWLEWDSTNSPWGRTSGYQYHPGRDWQPRPAGKPRRWPGRLVSGP